MSEYRVVVAVDKINVIEWCPGDDGEHPEQVHILFGIPLIVDDSEVEKEVTFAIRLKSRRAVDDLIAALSVHAAGVWPP
jgi:hypothetical protein